MTEQVQCNICDNFDSRNLFSAESVIYMKCNSCGLVYAVPRPIEEDLEDFYHNTYYDYTDPEINRTLFTRFMLRRLKLIETVKDKGSLLEIGCGVGYFLLLAKQSGWNICGVELSKWSSDYARKVYGLDVKTGMLKTAGFPKDRFDVVLLNHVLEHMPNPFAELNHVYKILKQSGIIVVDLPNFESLTSQVHREHWSLLRPKEHLYQFTPKTLHLLLKKAGFTVIATSTVSGIFDFGDPSKSLEEALSSLKFHTLLRDGFHYAIGKLGLGDDLTVVAKK